MKMGFRNALGFLKRPGRPAAAPPAAASPGAAEPATIENQPRAPEPYSPPGDAEDESVAEDEEEEDDRPETPPGLAAAGGMAAQVRDVPVFARLCHSLGPWLAVWGGGLAYRPSVPVLSPGFRRGGGATSPLRTGDERELEREKQGERTEVKLRSRERRRMWADVSPVCQAGFAASQGDDPNDEEQSGSGSGSDSEFSYDIELPGIDQVFALVLALPDSG